MSSLLVKLGSVHQNLRRLSTHYEEDEENISDGASRPLISASERSHDRGNSSRAASTSSSRRTNRGSTSGYGSLRGQDGDEEVDNIGWSWSNLIVIGSFLSTVISNGILLSAGLLIQPFIQNFEYSLATCGFPVYLLVSTYHLFTPASVLIIRRFGPRCTCVAGAVIAAGALLQSSHATSLINLVISFGVLAGLGLNLISMSSKQSLEDLNNDLFSYSSGIRTCGIGLGVLIMAPLTQSQILLSPSIGWRYSIRLLAELSVVCAIIGFILPIKLRRETSRAGQTNSRSANGQSQPGYQVASQSNEEPPAEDQSEAVASVDQSERAEISRQISADSAFEAVVDGHLVYVPEIPVVDKSTVILMSIVQILCLIAEYSFVIFLPKLCQHNGLANTDVCNVLVSVGVAGTVAKLLWVWFQDGSSTSQQIVCLITIFAAIGVPIAMIYLTVIHLMMFLAGILGFCIGSCSPRLDQLIAVGAKNVESCMPLGHIVNSVTGLLMAILLPLLGYLIHTFHTYLYSYACISGLLFLAALTLFWSLVAKKALHLRRRDCYQHV